MRQAKVSSGSAPEEPKQPTGNHAPAINKPAPKKQQGANRCLRGANSQNN